MFYRTLTFLILLGSWALFSGQIDAFHLALGILSAGFVTVISGDLLFADRQSGFLVRLKQGWRLGGYLVWLLWQVFLANIHLLVLAFGDQKNIQPSIICFQTGLKSDFEKFMLANSITLTPGTITIKIRGDQMCVHSISQKTAASLNEGSMEDRIAAIFRREPGHNEEKRLMISDGILMGAGMALFAMMATALYRIVAGPTAIDRIVAANVIGTKTAVLLVIIGEIFHDVAMFVDFALAYALLNFIGSLAASRYLHKTKIIAGDSLPLEQQRDKN